MAVSKLTQEIHAMAEAFSFSQLGFAPLEKPTTFELYKDWVTQGLGADMVYLNDHLPLKENPQKLLPQARSAIVVSKNYLPHPKPMPTLESAQVALYAKGEDYHRWFKKSLQALATQLEQRFADHVFMAMTDSAPVLERDLARKAGLGWVGKNTCLIHPKQGSLFFIGEIYTSLDLDSPAEQVPDFCGKCTRCLDACPTGAFIEPRKLDANKCISYWTIESKQVPPESLRSSIGDWFFGCDVCQTVCPWNQKPFADLLPPAPTTDSLASDLRRILTSSGKSLLRQFHGTALLRAGPTGLKRNALIVAANHQLKELVPEIESYLTHEKLADLAKWTLQQIKRRTP